MSLIKVLAIASIACLCAAEDSTLDQTHGLDPAQQYPVGDPRRCVGGNSKVLQRFEVLPGGGFDNLRNKDVGSVVSHNYTLCRTTDDGRFVIPDGVFTIPMKSSKVETFAELIQHWTNYTSTLSRSVNVHAGLNLPHVGISGKFSDEYEHVKSRQFYDKSMTTRVQVRYVRYTAKTEPDTPLTDGFRNRLRKIAAHLVLNRTDLAQYESQLLVRDFGTHVITSVDAGAALVQIDHIRAEYVRKYESETNKILASASASFFHVFDFGAEYTQTTTKEMMDTYLTNRTSSHVQAFGGPIYRPHNYTSDTWSQNIANDMVALDVSGDPLYYVINEATLPDVPPSTVYDVYDTVKSAVELYYKHNTHRGCISRDSPNFSFQANVDDGTCKPPNTNFTFGGVYQECSLRPNSYTNLCSGMTQVNPLTGAKSCPSGYEAILMQSGSKASSVTRHECHSCWLFFHCCNNNVYTASATYDAYWCVATGKVAADHGFLFGGLFTKYISNPLTQTKTCPFQFYPLKLLNDLIVCVSDDYELGTQYSLPFAGFFSCHSGNPLALDQNSGLQTNTGNMRTLQKYMLESGVSTYPRGCPKGFSQHLAVVDHGCEINYCVKSGALSPQGLPKVQRPPFMPAPKDVHTTAQSKGFVFNDDGTTWTTMEDAMQSFPAPKSGPPNTRAPDDEDSSSALSGGAIAGISVIATIACIVAGAILFVVIRRKRSRVYREADMWDNPRTPLNGSGYTQSLETPNAVVSHT